MMKRKILALACSAFLSLGVLTAALPQTAEAAASIGYVNVQKVFNTHPEMSNIRSTLQVEQQKLEKEFAEKSKNMSDKDKAAYLDKLRGQLIQKERSLIEPLQKKIRQAIEKAAKEKGVETVIDASAIVYGGLDLTDDVVKAAK